MDTITLELLRHGPSHNQLLSPLTSYLALCENHGAVTLNIPFEHAQLLHRLSALRYEGDVNDKSVRQNRCFQINDAARELGGVLAKIPGLIAETNKIPRRTSDIGHLRLIISANELALLPFELAFAPEGCPGAGQHLALQPHAPLCVTREVRRAPTPFPKPTGDFRVLFIAAAPPEVGEIPLKAHNLALRRAVAPWVKYFTDQNRKERVEDHLVVLPNATIEEIADHCAVGGFTHVHILAHGVNNPDCYGDQYFIALHSARDRSTVDYVSGKRLAAALRPNRRAALQEKMRPSSWYGERASNGENCGGIALPLVVTLATCDGGAVGSVIGAGASIAHDLHDAGIPIVAASQFPLTFAGSVRMVETLYQGLLWGEDPRLLMHALRRRLYADLPESHDWAGLTLYAALPEEFDSIIAELRVRRAHAGMAAAMSFADAYINLYVKNQGEKRAEIKEELDKIKERIDLSISRLKRLIKCAPGYEARIYGLLGSSLKRQAESYYLQNKDGDDYIKKFKESRLYYYKSYQADRANSWALVQYLSLEFFITSKELRGKEFIAEKLDRIIRYITAAEVMSNEDSSSYSDIRKAWALGNLVEIEIIKGMIKISPYTDNDHKIGEFFDIDKALDFIKDMLQISNPYSFEAYSTLQQIKRYKRIYFEPLAKDLSYYTSSFIDQLIAEFPDDLEEAWA
jgi:hypothetical protein